MKRAAAVNVAAVLTHYGYRAVNCVGTVAADAQCFEQSLDSVHFKAYYSAAKEVLRVSRGKKVLFDGEPAELEKALVKIHQIPLPLTVPSRTVKCKLCRSEFTSNDVKAENCIRCGSVKNRCERCGSAAEGKTKSACCGAKFVTFETFLQRPGRAGVTVEKSIARAVAQEDPEYAAEHEEIMKAAKGEPEESIVVNAAVDVINTYGLNQNIEDVLVQRTGCSLAAARRAVDVAVKSGRVPTAQGINFADPKYRFQERVAQCMRKGLSREDAEETIKNVITYKEQEPLAKEGATVRLDKLLDGQRFKNEVRDERNRVRNTYTGCVLYRTPGRVRVLLDAGPAQERSFTTRDGDNVTIHSSGRKEQNYAPDVEVIVLAGREDTALLLGKKDVQSSMNASSSDFNSQMRSKGSKVKSTKSNQLPEREGDNMAAKKRAAKKSKANGNGESKRPRISTEAVVKRLKGPNDEQIKRHVDILSTLKENGDRMTVAELAKAFGKVAKTKQDPVKVFHMHRKALVDGGFITVTEPKAEAAAA